MRFTLYYRGRLPSQGRKNSKRLVQSKCEIRNALMPQLRDAWEQLPLDDKQWLDPAYRYGALHEVGGQRFSAIVNEKHHAIADLKILFLRPAGPGGLVGQGGDLDNRIKTLLDALSIPKEEQLSDKFSHDQCDGISHCLLEDDSLISGLSIEVDRLFDPQAPKEVLLVISVRIRRTSSTMQNLDFAA